ncbi:MAG: hypothetical protein IJ831_09520 [Spirochaetales bacterium]|nr:hypothetical protein [Spirochaetales bacterium]
MSRRKSSYILDPFKFGVSILTAAASLVICVTMIVISRPIETAVFLIIAAIFLREASINMNRIYITDEGARMDDFRGRTLLFFRWDEIEEIGVAGSKVFPKSDKGKRGTLYIYISRNELTDQERFEMMFKFPPRNIITMVYDRDRLDAIQIRYTPKLKKFNTGSAELPFED